MEIDKKRFLLHLDQYSFKEHGDFYEQSFGNRITEYFPNCELFWRYFVVPSTNRIVDYPYMVEDRRIQDFISSEIEEITIAHYSMFVKLVWAHIEESDPPIRAIENIYTYMASACDLAEVVIEKVYFLILHCQGRVSHILQELKREEFLELTGEYYDKNYENLYNFYLKRGKIPPMRLICAEDIFKEFFGNSSSARIEYATHSNIIRRFRNLIIHNSRIASLIDVSSGKHLMPLPSKISDYLTWRKVEEAAKNPNIIKSDFVEQSQQAFNDLQKLEEILNNLWEKLIEDFKQEFFSEERNLLRKKYGLEMESDTLINSQQKSDFHIHLQPRPSGTYSGGSALYDIGNQENNLNDD